MDEQQIHKVQADQEMLKEQKMRQAQAEQKQRQRQMQKAKEKQQNQNTGKMAADIAAKSGVPYAAAAGKAVKGADALTGGKASEALGKAIKKANKRNGLQGKIMQKAMDKAAGNDDKKKDEADLSNSPLKLDSQSAGENTELSKEALENNDGTIKTFLVTAKKIMIPIVAVCSFMILIYGAIYIPIVSLLKVMKVEDASQRAEDFTDSFFEEAIGKMSENAYLIPSENTDIPVFSSNKLEKSNLVYTSKTETKTTKKSSDVNHIINDFSELSDMFPDVNLYKDGEDPYLVYNFYTKLYELNTYYYENYNVNLDTPLIVMTLSIQSDDMYDVFYSNTTEYQKNNFENIFKKMFSWTNSTFDYYHDWSGYELKKDEAPHDMEILAQAMIKEADSSECNAPKDGKCYIVDYEKYDEFLMEFIEKKYFLTGDASKLGTTSSGNKTTPEKNGATNITGDWSKWEQKDPRWNTKTLGNSSYIMDHYGCAVTSIAILIAKSGVKTKFDTFDPGVAVENLSFTGNGDLYWESTTNLSDNFKYYKFVSFTGLSEAGVIKKLNKYNLDKYYILLEVPYAGASHFIALNYVDSTIHVIDPIPFLCSTPNDVYSCYDHVKGAYIYEKTN